MSIKTTKLITADVSN